MLARRHRGSVPKRHNGGRSSGDAPHIHPPPTRSQPRDRKVSLGRLLHRILRHLKFPPGMGRTKQRNWRRRGSGNAIFDVIIMKGNIHSSMKDSDYCNFRTLFPIKIYMQPNKNSEIYWTDIIRPSSRLGYFCYGVKSLNDLFLISFQLDRTTKCWRCKAKSLQAQLKQARKACQFRGFSACFFPISFKKPSLSKGFAGPLSSPLLTPRKAHQV